MKYNYAFDKKQENVVKVVGRDLNISTKQAVEICSFIRKLHLGKAKTLLERVMKKQHAIPFKRFTEGAGHKKGVGAGKYPINASKQFLKLLKTLEANAQNKGLSPELKIIHACAQRAAEPLHYGRKRRISMKRTHVELVAEEIEHEKKEPKKEEKKASKEIPKTKPAVKTTEAKKASEPVAKPQKPDVKEVPEKKSEAKKEEKPAEKKPEAKPVEIKKETKQEAKK